jgi:hypothetical protein
LPLWSGKTATARTRHYQGDLTVTDVAPTPTPPPAVVSIPEVGDVTLATIDQTMAMRTQAAADEQSLGQQASALQNRAEQKFADAGAMLVPKPAQANLPAAHAQEADKAQQRVAQMASIDAQLHELDEQPHSGLSAVFAKVGNWNERRKLQGQRDSVSRDLRQLLIALGRAGGETPIGEAASLVAQAVELERQAEQARTDAVQKSAQVAAYDQEIKLRQESQQQMGFDALYTAAYLTKYGPHPVESPLQLKKDEQAYLSVPATLSRNQSRTHYVGGSQGFSFPIGHTGIRYRVGSFQGKPVSQQVMTRIDNGSLVISSQRIAFIGTLKSVLIQLAKVVHVEVYNDAIAVFHEGRENPDFFLVKAPKQVVFYVNWAVNKLNA